MPRDKASNPLTERYASKEMSYLFSSDFKFRSWRRLWIALAEAEKELGLPITDAQLAELRENAEKINYEDAERREREVRHDVMSHIYAFGLQAPSAKGIIHLGATSAFVTDNTDIIQMAEALKLMRRRIVNLMAKLRGFAWTWRGTAALAFTHFQPAQLTTVGKRATLWLHDLLLDYREIEFRESQLALLGVKGATGTQASFLNLFEGDAAKVDRLEELVAEKIGLKRWYPVSGQTYSRKVDSQVINSLSGFAQSASKFAYDMRLLQHLPVAAAADAFHHQVLRHHERQLAPHVRRDDLFVHDDPADDVVVDQRQRIGREERFGNRDAAIRGVVERPLEPLRRRGERGIERVDDEVPRQRVEPLRAHRIALVRHRR